MLQYTSSLPLLRVLHSVEYSMYCNYNREYILRIIIRGCVNIVLLHGRFHVTRYWQIYTFSHSRRCEASGEVR